VVPESAELSMSPLLGSPGELALRTGCDIDPRQFYDHGSCGILTLPRRLRALRHLSASRNTKSGQANARRTVRKRQTLATVKVRPPTRSISSSSSGEPSRGVLIRRYVRFTIENKPV